MIGPGPHSWPRYDAGVHLNGIIFTGRNEHWTGGIVLQDHAGSAMTGRRALCKARLFSGSHLLLCRVKDVELEGPCEKMKSLGNLAKVT